MPDEETVQKTYDNIDFLRGVEVVLQGMPAASIYEMCNGYAEAGLPYHSVGISEDLLAVHANDSFCTKFALKRAPQRQAMRSDELNL